MGDVPEGVYYSAVNDNFYRVSDGAGMGVAFWQTWRKRCWDFPPPAIAMETRSGEKARGERR